MNTSSDKPRLLSLRIKRHAGGSSCQRRQRLEKESKRKRCTPERLRQIEAELAQLVCLEHQRAVLRTIRTRRQKLSREAERANCSMQRRREIGQELANLIQLEHQECETGKPKKHPSSRLSLQELGFATNEPSGDEIIERAIIQRGLRFGKPHSMFAKLAEHDAARWGTLVEREGRLHPEIKRASERIQFGDLKGVAETRLYKFDRIIAEHYFQTRWLKTPLCRLSSDKASLALLTLDVEISPDAFDRALRRLCLVR